MEIRLAKSEDKRQILKYDCHIRPDRLDVCIGQQLVYVLCEKENILGVLRYSLFWQSIPFLDLIFLDDSCRGRGYGRQMMAHWEEAMGRMGCGHVMLSTQADETARFFYEKLDYQKIGAFLPPDQEADELMYLKELVK